MPHHHHQMSLGNFVFVPAEGLLGWQYTLKGARYLQPAEQEFISVMLSSSFSMYH